jgi:hypothetical protein
MKKTLSVLVGLMIISGVAVARWTDNPGAVPGVAVVKSGTTYKLFYKGTAKMDVKVSILDASDNVVFTEILKKVEGFIRPYNFLNLPEGEYTIEIADKNGRQVESVSYQKGKLEKLAHLLKVSGTEGKYLLTVSNKDAGSIRVRIFDDSHNTIYDHQEEIKSDFAKIYNLEKVSGKFTFEITDEEGRTKSFGY